eukprot:CAMPEP_0202730600 /NCGR_PEP_ID=MMETSP1385-20130828/186721_1 /ASSEMBLY_ACC=CAM_ASM_000861 /TAXON_ID=933848 /ORGANISM="Elphidium margaritaceum" /LENGTH=1187 /DNA_ID=CAMNT_0049396877 /DNA_START=1 /DNA_END=3564 /DNA_ORIENTATION=-
MEASDDVDDEADPLNPPQSPFDKNDDDDEHKHDASVSPPIDNDQHNANQVAHQEEEEEDIDNISDQTANDNDGHYDEGWLSNPRRLCFICCACIVFSVMTLVVLLQFYSDEYKAWTSYTIGSDGIFLTSPTDVNRSFDIITLNNGLDVLLISDKSTDKSAAAIDIGIGSSSDPLQFLGLAHFHEHMLFLGSKTYASLDSFSSYVSMNGGRDNAYTESEHTNFFFQVDNQHLEHSLDIFSRFFIDPLLTKKSMKDEIWAVDNEYRKDLPSQTWRDWRMLEFSANPQHTFHKFTVGSIQSLTKHGNDAVYNEMLRFHNKWVKSNLMKLVIYGKDDLRTLRKWAADKFSAIPANDSLTSTPVHHQPAAALSTPYRSGVETGQIYYIETIAKQKQVTYIWGLSGALHLHAQYRSPVMSFINNRLLQSATNHSLYNVLKVQLLYITSMDCDTFYNEADWTGTSISFELTDRGEQHLDEISFYLFKYLRLLLETAAHNHALAQQYNLYFAEDACIDTLFFNYYSLIKKDSYSVVSALAKRMQYRDSTDLLYPALNVAPQRLALNVSLMVQVLRFMAQPRHVIMHYTNDKFKSTKFNELEPFFKIRFRRTKISAELLHRWSNIDAVNGKDGTLPLMIPPLNPYILQRKTNACDLQHVELIDLKKMAAHHQRPHDSSSYELPMKIVNEASINIWYKPDTKFASPRININLLYVSPLIYDRAIHALYAEIWLQLINFYSSDWYSQVAMASYAFELSLNHQGIVFSITGLGHSYLSPLLQTFIAEYVTNVQKYIARDADKATGVLNIILISLQRTYKNLNYDHVWTQGYFAMYDIVKVPHFDRHLMLQLVTQLLASKSSSTEILQKVMRHVDDVLQTGFVLEGFFHGNLYRKQAMEIVATVKASNLAIRQSLQAQSTLQQHLFKMQHLQLAMKIPDTATTSRKFVYQGWNSNEKDTNDVVQVWYQFESNSFSQQNYVETCKVLLLARMMKSESFQVLRTQESLGYVATTFSKSSVGATNNINYLVVMVASGYKSAHYLHERVKHFVDEHYYRKVLLKLRQSPRTFELYINGTVNDLKKRDLTLAQETSLIWDEIIGHTYFFAWKPRFIEILQALTLEDMIRFYEQKVIGKQAKWISIQLFHQKTKKDDKKLLQLTAMNAKPKTHPIIAKKSDDNDILYFNDTKDLQKLGYAQYFHVY